MKVMLRPGGNSVEIVREPRDPQYYSDSALFVAIKRELQRKGMDVIKKLMWKDGHMVSDDQYYVRSRDHRSPDSFAIYWGHHAEYGPYEDWNQKGLVKMLVALNLSEA